MNNSLLFHYLPLCSPTIGFVDHLTLSASGEYIHHERLEKYTID
jgi:hypothetical protein